ncbi:MAG: hypothetical protein U0790_20010 [Isosphaeraceae bacterium]
MAASRSGSNSPGCLWPCLIGVTVPLVRNVIVEWPNGNDAGLFFMGILFFFAFLVRGSGLEPPSRTGASRLPDRPASPPDRHPLWDRQLDQYPL